MTRQVAITSSRKLREKLRDPEFRRIPGFPKGEDEDILRLSDPPYYTACPNPFLEDFVRRYGKPYHPSEDYHREPFAVDVSEGKTDQLFQLHSYHTKVPYRAIVPSILHYTEPGDIVLDGFCGSGMTGVAAQWCGTASAGYKQKLEREWLGKGWRRPKWGARRSILGDLSPAATFIAANYTMPFDVKMFADAAHLIFEDLKLEIGWMYETTDENGEWEGRIEYTVWSEIFACPHCTSKVNFVSEALDWATKKTRSQFPCPTCNAVLSKKSLERSFRNIADPATGEPIRQIGLQPVLVNCKEGASRTEKPPNAKDRALLERIEALPLPVQVPTHLLPIDVMYHGSRLGPKGFTRVHHLFLPRPIQALATIWRKTHEEPDHRIRNMLLFLFEQGIWTMSVLNRYQPAGYKQVNKFLNGVYYVPSQHCEVSPWYALAARSKRIENAFTKTALGTKGVVTTTGDCASIAIPEASVDYIFTDPPFGENIFYADLNFLVESWHRIWTDSEPEAIVDRPKNKGTQDYQDLMRHCFAEYHRVLKPGRWMTVVFSNSSNAIWRAIQEAIGTAGFVVADVRTLDKKAGSYRQVTSSAVKQDLVISAYKPSAILTQHFQLQDSPADTAWVFTREHLANVPVFVADKGEAEVIVERTPQMLHDRMIAFYVQRGAAVPLDTGEFLGGLADRFPERDGCTSYLSRWRSTTRSGQRWTPLQQFTLFPKDEATAIQWIRQQLQGSPRTIKDCPHFHERNP